MAHNTVSVAFVRRKMHACDWHVAVSFWYAEVAVK